MLPVGRKMKTEIPAEWGWLIIPGAPAGRSREYAKCIHP